MIKIGLIALVLFYFSNPFAQHITVFTAFTGQNQERVKEQSEDFGKAIKNSIHPIFFKEDIRDIYEINCGVPNQEAGFQTATRSLMMADSSTIHFAIIAGGWDVRKANPDSIYFGLPSNKISIRYLLNFLGFIPSKNQICIFLLPYSSGQPITFFDCMPVVLSQSGQSFIQIQADKETDFDDLLDELIDSIEDNDGGNNGLDTNLDKIIDLNEWLTGLNKSFEKRELKPKFFQQTIQPAKNMVLIKK